VDYWVIYFTCSHRVTLFDNLQCSKGSHRGPRLPLWQKHDGSNATLFAVELPTESLEVILIHVTNFWKNGYQSTLTKRIRKLLTMRLLWCEIPIMCRPLHCHLYMFRCGTKMHGKTILWKLMCIWNDYSCIAERRAGWTLVSGSWRALRKSTPIVSRCKHVALSCVVGKKKIKPFNYTYSHNTADWISSRCRKTRNNRRHNLNGSGADQKGNVSLEARSDVEQITSPHNKLSSSHQKLLFKISPFAMCTPFGSSHGSPNPAVCLWLPITSRLTMACAQDDSKALQSTWNSSSRWTDFTVLSLHWSTYAFFSWLSQALFLILTKFLDKEQWEPVIEYLFSQSHSSLDHNRIREAWAFDWPTNGDAGVLNREMLEQRTDGVCEFLLFAGVQMPTFLSPSCIWLGTRSRLIPPLKTRAGTSYRTLWTFCWCRDSVRSFL
jgi:hypothetical protein